MKKTMSNDAAAAKPKAEDAIEEKVTTEECAAEEVVVEEAQDDNKIDEADAVAEEAKKEAELKKQEEMTKRLIIGIAFRYRTQFRQISLYSLEEEKTLEVIKEEINKMVSPLNSLARKVAIGLDETLFDDVCKILNISYYKVVEDVK